MAVSYDELTEILTGWDPWSDYDGDGAYVPDHEDGCTYCSSRDTSMADPYTSRPCCRNCFFTFLDEPSVEEDEDYPDADEVDFEEDGCAT